MQKERHTLEFIKRLFRSNKASNVSTDTFRGAAPAQTQEEQDAMRARMEAEMASQKERRESPQSDK